MDYQALLFDPNYTVHGVPVLLTLADVSEPVGLTAIDKTAGVDVGVAGAQVQTIKPAAVRSVAELTEKGLTIESLHKATLEMNGFQWTVASTRARPSPKGENDGEVFLILHGKRPVESDS